MTSEPKTTASAPGRTDKESDAPGQTSPPAECGGITVGAAAPPRTQREVGVARLARWFIFFLRFAIVPCLCSSYEFIRKPQFVGVVGGVLSSVTI